MSQEPYDIVKGIAQAAANAYDGAHDDKGEPIEIGLKREEGHPVLDSREMDGFKVRIDGTHVIITYQATNLIFFIGGYKNPDTRSRLNHDICLAGVFKS